MIHPIVVFFLLMSSIFAGVHYAAMVANLYSYFWWFDIVMHFWGGLLLVWEYMPFQHLVGCGIGLCYLWYLGCWR
jgi:hypothetical protein